MSGMTGGDITTLTGNVGGLIPATGSGNFNILGGGGITVTGVPATHTLTITGGGVPAITNHALAVGTGVTITSLGLGLTGEVLTGVTGADPVFSATPSVTSITSTNFYTSPLTTGSTLSAATWAGDGTDVNIDMTITPKGTGDLVLTLGDVSISSGNLLLPTTSSTVGQILVNAVQRFHTFGTDNLFIGGSGNFTMSAVNARRNVGVGLNSLSSLVGTNANEGAENCAFGLNVLVDISSARGNSCLGFGSATTLKTGNWNVVLGHTCGTAYVGAESSNIIIGYGIAGTAGESNKIRIGSGTGAGAGQIDATYICGIYSTAPGATRQIVFADNTNKLGGLNALPPIMGGAVAWTTAVADVTPAITNTGYLIKHATPATQLVITLPTTAALYDELEIDGYTAGMWKLAQNAGQTIHYGSLDTTPGAGGYLEATHKYDSVKLRCVVADTEFLVIRSFGNLTTV